MPWLRALDSNFWPPIRGASAILRRERNGRGRGIEFYRNENMISMNRACDHGGNTGRKSERSFKFSMKNMTCERVGKMMTRGFEWV